MVTEIVTEEVATEDSRSWFYLLDLIVILAAISLLLGGYIEYAIAMLLVSIRIALHLG